MKALPLHNTVILLFYRLIAALVLLGPVFQSSPALASPSAKFDPEVAVYGQTLKLRGTGRLSG